MTVVPAQVAGVGAVVVAIPGRPGRGRVHPVLLGAAGLLEVDALLVAGGAQAIGALAYGLPDAGLEPVDLIVGPGNAWVTAAKIEVCGEVGIDLPAGPVRGHGPRRRRPRIPDRVAADLITQAEHGPDSPAILVTTDAALADAVEAEVAGTARDRVAAATSSTRALAAHGRIVARARPRRRDRLRQRRTRPSTCRWTSSRSSRPSPGSATRARCSSGRWAPESAGDYATGANHVLPTGGLARASGGSGGRDVRQVHAGPADRRARASRRSRATIRTLAEAEGLLAHRDAVDARASTTTPEPAR